MDARQPGPGHEEPTDTTGPRRGTDPSWWRVAFAVGVVVVVGTVAAQAISMASLNPGEPYGTGSVTIAGQTHEADVCESLEHGIEVVYGSQREVLYVRHMGPPEVHANLEVEPEMTDGTFLVRRTDGGQQWSDAATVLEHTTDGSSLQARFDEVGLVTTTYETGGWCDGADPNAWWR